MTDKNLKAERQFVALIAHDLNALKRTIDLMITDDYFVEIFHIDFFNTIIKYYNEFFSLPSAKDVSSLIVNNMTAYKLDEIQQAKLWRKRATAIYKINTSNFKFKQLLSSLETARKSRFIKKTIVNVSELYEKGNYDAAIDELYRSMQSQKKIEISEGDLFSDLKQHENEMRKVINNEYVAIKSNITGVVENDNGEHKICVLDDFIEGGSYKGEMTLIIGENNIGKSFALMEFAYAAARNKFNVLFVTVEMNKIKQQRRFYSRITGIKYSHFKQATMTTKMKKLWHDKVEQFNKECGFLYVVAFSQGCTVNEIKIKANEVQERKNVIFDMIVIDYLNDLRPTGKYTTAKDWGAMGEISWELASLAKSFNDDTGVALITANQQKSTSAKRGGIITWNDAAFSPLVPQHTTTGIGITRSANDLVIGRICWNIWKMRDGEKGAIFYTFPNFCKSRIWSVKRINEYYCDNSNNNKEEVS